MSANKHNFVPAKAFPLAKPSNITTCTTLITKYHSQEYSSEREFHKTTPGKCHLVRNTQAGFHHITGEKKNRGFNFFDVQRFNSYSIPFCSSSLVHSFPLTVQRKASVLAIIQQTKVKRKKYQELVSTKYTNEHPWTFTISELSTSCSLSSQSKP